MMHIEYRVSKTLSDLQNIPIHLITPQTTLESLNCGIDSMRRVLLWASLEIEFDRCIATQKLSTIEDVCEYIQQS